MSKRLCFWSSLAILGGIPGAATAQPADAPIILWWEPPPGADCPTADVVMAEVERLLGGKPGANTGRRLFARARVAIEEDGTWKLTLRTMIAREEADGERLLHAPTCEGLAGAAALIVALGFDPAAVAAQAERSQAMPPKPAAKDEKPPAPPPAPRRPRPPAVLSPPAPAVGRVSTGSSVWVHPGLGFGIGGDVGSFSTPAYSFHLWGSLRYRQLQLIAAVGYYPPHMTPAPDVPTAGGTFTLITFDLLGCGAVATFRAGSLELALCGGAEIGQMRAKGYGVRSPGEGAALWAAPRLGGALTAALTGAVRLRLDLGLVVPVTRSPFVLEHVGMVHEPSYVCGRADAGVEFHF